MATIGIELTARQRALLARRLGDRTQSWLGEQATAPQEHISAILAGKKRPSEELLRRICGALGLRCSIDLKVDIRAL
jgi:transcriptional regulator with XRE-family HTH domain